MERKVKRVTGWVYTVVLWCLIISTGFGVGEKVERYGKLYEVPVNSIKAQGWLKTFFDRQASGLGGNPQMSGYPFDTKMWQGEVMAPPGHFSDSWWPYEQTGYYLDGILRAGYLDDKQALIDRARANIDSVLANPREDNLLGPQGNSDWSRTVFFRALMAEYDATGNQKIIDAMSRHYLTTPRLFTKGRDRVNIEPLLWLYSRNGNHKLLEMAVQSFGAINVAASNTKPSGHGVAWCELAKIPALLYLYTGNEDYLRMSVNAFNKLIEYHVLVDGCPSSVENLSGKAPDMAHETCDTVDLCWSLGYLVQATGDAKWADMMERDIFNAGLGALEKNFHSHQYYSSPNQSVCAEDTSQYDKAWGIMTRLRFCYKPTHDTECCTGNIERMMPAFACRMWMKTPDNGIAAVLYGPSETTQQLGASGAKVMIAADTDYPFDETVTFKVKTDQKVKFPFLLRIPGWCSGASLKVNGQPVTVKLKKGTFFTLDREFQDGDTLELTLPMEISATRWGQNQRGIALERGPLVYSLAVKTRALKYNDKRREGIWNFPCWFLYPDGPWSYALDLNEKTLNQAVKAISKKTNGYVWDNPPIELQAPARKVLNWKLDGTRHTPEWPADLQLARETEQIRLVPLGSTMLRMTIFPTVTEQEHGTLSH